MYMRFPNWLGWGTVFEYQYWSKSTRVIVSLLTIVDILQNNFWGKVGPTASEPESGIMFETFSPNYAITFI